LIAGMGEALSSYSMHGPALARAGRG
jgi:hypothetical protein